MPDARASLAAFIRWVMRDTRYLGTYACTVQGQVGNLLDLLPDDPTIAGKGLSGVPIRHGLPGCEVRVRTGARVLLAFENGGDPTKPYAALWSEGDIVSVSLGYGGTKPVARVGDTVSVFFPAAIPFSGTVGGVPASGVLTIPQACPGIIDGSGNPKVLA